MPLSTAQIAFLANYLDRVPDRTSFAAQNLTVRHGATYPNVTFGACRADKTLLRIGGNGAPDNESRKGGIDIHPDTVDELMANGRLTDLLAGLNETDEDLRMAALASFQRSTNERYRFDETFQKTITELEAVPGNLDGLQGILDNASPADKNRMAQIQISHKSPEEAAINTRGVELALQMNAQSCGDVVAYVEFFYKIIEPDQRRIKAEVNQLPLPVNDPPNTRRQNRQWRKDQVTARLRDFMGADTLSQERLDDARQIIDDYTNAMAIFCGAPVTSQALDGASDSGMQTELERLATTLLFTSQVSAGYHLLKHFTDMYGALHDGDLDSQATHYTTEARDAVATSDRCTTSKGQTGSTSFAFSKGGFTTYVPVKGADAELASFF